MVMELKDCPEFKSHTPAPDGYLQYAYWAEKKAKTHDVDLCMGCQRYVIWRKKKRNDPHPNPLPHPEI